MIKEATTWLENFQSTQEAWSVAYRRPPGPEGPNVLVVAQTLPGLVPQRCALQRMQSQSLAKVVRDGDPHALQVTCWSCSATVSKCDS